MTLEEITAKVKAEVETLAATTVADVSQEIFKSGILDSMNVLHIITFIEGEFGISVDAFDISLETLDSVSKIAAYVQSKLEAG